MSLILSGTPVALKIEEEIRQKILLLPSKKPSLAVILVGKHGPSHTYVNMKKKACASVGIKADLHVFSEEASEKEILMRIKELNKDPRVNGILLQLPLPSHLQPRIFIEAIDPKKDVDGLHPLNIGKLLLGFSEGFIPCTPLGIQVLLSHYNIKVAGKHVVILGRSAIVGKPLAALFLHNTSNGNATVTIAHSHTQNLTSLTRTADILIAAIGIPGFVKEDMVSKGVVIIDVGINRVDDLTHLRGYRLVGDVDFSSVEKKCSAITPVPKGVGPMTVAMLLHNTFLSFERSI